MDDFIIYARGNYSKILEMEPKKGLGLVRAFEAFKRFIIQTFERMGEYGHNLSRPVIDYYNDLFSGNLLNENLVQEPYVAQNAGTIRIIKDGLYTREGSEDTFGGFRITPEEIKKIQELPMGELIKEDWTLDRIKTSLKNGEYVDPFVMVNHLSDEQVRQEYNAAIEAEIRSCLTLIPKLTQNLKRPGIPLESVNA